MEETALGSVSVRDEDVVSKIPNVNAKNYLVAVWGPTWHEVAKAIPKAIGQSSELGSLGIDRVKYGTGIHRDNPRRNIPTKEYPGTVGRPGWICIPGGIIGIIGSKVSTITPV